MFAVLFEFGVDNSSLVSNDTTDNAFVSKKRRSLKGMNDRLQKHMATVRSWSLLVISFPDLTCLVFHTQWHEKD
ncbi:hypothetical protein X975_24650, partial [Stegodyphus mimosarum]